MTQWQCEHCGYAFAADCPPEHCPSCHETCSFRDVTCYTPDCGGPRNIDPRLVAPREKTTKR